MAGDHTFNTDEIVEVFEHLAKDKRPWLEIICDQGIDGVKVQRALNVIFPEGDQRLVVAKQAFALGAQFGAMRLEPVPWDPEAADTCQCFLCVLRRQAEAEAAEEEAEGGEDA